MIEDTLHCRRALLPDGWAHNVRIRLSGDGIIADVESGCALPAGASAIATAIPGMPNAHCHAFQRAMAGLAEFRLGSQDTFWTWRNTMYTFANRVTPDELTHIASQLYLEMLQAGFTSVAEFHYIHHEPGGRPYGARAAMALALMDAAAQVGIGQTLLPVLYMGAGFGSSSVGPGQRRFATEVDTILGIISDAHRSRPAPERQRVGAALHSLRAVPAAAAHDLLNGLHATQKTAPVHIHVAEQQAEVEQCIAWSGQRPVAWLLEHLPVDARWCLVHATHLDAAEISALAASDASVCVCPVTEANLGDGLFPLRAFVDAGGRLAIGSDSNISVSVAEELRWLEYGQRLATQSRNVIADGTQPHSGSALYTRALAGGAQALGQPVGRLQKGYRADILSLDDNSPPLAHTPDHYLLDSFVFSGNQPMVRDVMVAGRWCIRNFQHPAQATINANYRNAVKRLRET